MYIIPLEISIYTLFLRKSKNIKKCQGLITRGQGQSWGNTALSQGRGMYWAPSNPSK